MSRQFGKCLSIIGCNQLSLSQYTCDIFPLFYYLYLSSCTIVMLIQLFILVLCILQCLESIVKEDLPLWQQTPIHFYEYFCCQCKNYWQIVTMNRIVVDSCHAYIRLHLHVICSPADHTEIIIKQWKPSEENLIIFICSKYLSR